MRELLAVTDRLDSGDQLAADEHETLMERIGRGRRRRSRTCAYS
ncbi:hypothetical protein ABZW18_20535 [Streptomyces sp. NPDC004647]